MTVQQIYDLLDKVAPFDTQVDFDNSGLLVGSRTAEVTGILFALDVTEAVIREAVSKNANLIVTHHPLMFDPIRRLTDDDYESRLILHLAKADISLIASHTCLDRADGGINDALAEACALLDVEGEDFVRVGNLSAPITASELREYLSIALDTTVRLMGDPDRYITRLGLCSGAGGGEWEKAVALGADAFMSGEIHHHHALAMTDRRIPCFECGHFATEQPGIFALADALKSALQSSSDQVKYRVSIYKSEASAYGSASVPGQAE